MPLPTRLQQYCDPASFVLLHLHQSRIIYLQNQTHLLGHCLTHLATGQPQLSRSITICSQKPHSGVLVSQGLGTQVCGTIFRYFL